MGYQWLKPPYPASANHMIRPLLLILLILPLTLSACGEEVIMPVVMETPTAVPTVISLADTIDPAILTPSPMPTAAPSITPSPPPTWSPAVTESIQTQAGIFAAAQAELARAAPPERDDVALAMAYRGLTAVPQLNTPLVTEPLPLGTQQQFKIGNIDDNTISEIDTDLLAVSEHAYFWFQTGSDIPEPDETLLVVMTDFFDEIYESVIFYFGSEKNPGVDGDPRLHIVHASPDTLCTTDEESPNCRIAGYFSAQNLLPTSVDPNSNMREMFIMNMDQFGSTFYLNVLAHEFRHMVEENYDKGDADWEVEGSAMLAETLLGYPETGQLRGNLFLENPDQQLNSWSDNNTTARYGQGYLLNQYIYDRLGTDMYRQFATSPESGLLALDGVAAANGLNMTGQSLWLDWLVTLAVHDEPDAPDLYRYQELKLNTAMMTDVISLPTQNKTTVHQYAADYYQIVPTGVVTIAFTGSPLVHLLDASPPSGDSMWYAQRANYSHPRLTRSVNLQAVDAATLSYAAYVDIEEGYDFAYVSVSTDDGRSWQGLTAAGMQGLAPEDDPSASALTDRFYTGRQRGWIEEHIDLTPYAGQKIQLRFEYVTDPILTYNGFALDNISIPEIGFYDDVETPVEGWLAEGFTRTAVQLPQTWHLQLITFPDGVIQVEQLAIPPDQILTFSLDTAVSTKPPILIVAATAPMTLEKAYYTLTITGEE